MSNFRQVDRETGFLLPPSVDEWLPQRHLARFVVEVIEGLDLRAMSTSYRGSGSASYHPSMLLGLLVYGYATGVFSSRKLERASYDSVAFRFIAANDHPDHDTIATFRRRFLKDIEALFVEVLLLAREMGVLKLGAVGLDGTKIHANASRHSALSYEHAGKIEAQLKAEVAQLLAKAEAHCEARKIEEAALLGARLYPDMFPLARQVAVSTLFGRLTPGRLAGVELPDFPAALTSFAECRTRVADSLAFIGTLTAEQIDGTEDREYTFPAGGQPRTFTGLSYLQSFALPNFHFHTACAYMILRHSGVELGKKDYIGAS